MFVGAGPSMVQNPVHGGEAALSLVLKSASEDKTVAVEAKRSDTLWELRKVVAVQLFPSVDPDRVQLLLDGVPLERDASTLSELGLTSESALLYQVQDEDAAARRRWRREDDDEEAAKVNKQNRCLLEALAESVGPWLAYLAACGIALLGVYLWPTTRLGMVLIIVGVAAFVLLLVRSLCGAGSVSSTD